MNDVSRWAAAVFGVAMAALPAVGSGGAALVFAAAALVAVAAGTVVRSAATLAVLLTVGAVVAATPPLLLVASSGLCAVAYLVCRHAVGTPAGTVTGRAPTAVAAFGFSFAGVVAASFPLQVPWLPLVAPLGVLAIYVVVARPFLS